MAIRHIFYHLKKDRICWSTDLSSLVLLSNDKFDIDDNLEKGEICGRASSNRQSCGATRDLLTTNSAYNWKCGSQRELDCQEESISAGMHGDAQRGRLSARVGSLPCDAHASDLSSWTDGARQIASCYTLFYTGGALAFRRNNS